MLLTVVVVADVIKGSDVEKNVTLQVPVKGGHRNLINEFKERTGITQVEMVGRLLEWFSAQHRDVQREIMERGDAGTILARQKLAEMQGDDITLSADLTPEQVIEVQKAMTSRLEIFVRSFRVEMDRRNQAAPAGTAKPKS